MPSSRPTEAAVVLRSCADPSGFQASRCLFLLRLPKYFCVNVGGFQVMFLHVFSQRRAFNKGDLWGFYHPGTHHQASKCISVCGHGGALCSGHNIPVGHLVFSRDADYSVLRDFTVPPYPFGPLCEGGKSFSNLYVTNLDFLRVLTPQNTSAISLPLPGARKRKAKPNIRQAMA